MWDNLVSFSTWAENNSGQIQILIGSVAFWLAYKGYAKLLEQMQLASDQEEAAYKQNQFELKLSIVQNINSELAFMKATSIRIHFLINYYENNIKKISNRHDSNKIVENIQSQVTSLKKSNDSLKFSMTKYQEYIDLIMEEDDFPIATMQEQSFIVANLKIQVKEIESVVLWCEEVGKKALEAYLK